MKNKQPPFEITHKIIIFWRAVSMSSVCPKEKIYRQGFVFDCRRRNMEFLTLLWKFLA